MVGWVIVNGTYSRKFSSWLSPILSNNQKKLSPTSTKKLLSVYERKSLKIIHFACEILHMIHLLQKQASCTTESKVFGKHIP
jgi:hypothetical protein